jgi:hypothetical protein
LKALPKSLDETYDQILSSIDKEHYGHVQKILQWLAFSVRPVSLEEVAAALTVDLDHNCLLDPDQQLHDPHDILAICSSLVTMSVDSKLYSAPHLEWFGSRKSMLLYSHEIAYYEY